MEALFHLREVGPLVLAVLAAAVVDLIAARRGLLPPGFRVPLGAGVWAAAEASSRRTLAFLTVAFVLWIGVFSPLGVMGREPPLDPAALEVPQLFLLHLLFLLALVTWYLLGFAGTRGGSTAWLEQFGFRAARPWTEVAVGVVAGVGAWLFVLLALLGVGALVWALGGEELLPREPPALVPWIAGLPLWVRAAVSASAGLVEEAFFRGFLQPRVGIALSTAFFALAHLTYDQPYMLLGIALLSLLYGLLVRWRQNVWPAVVAHLLFDAIQLLLVIPSLLELMGEG